MIFLEEIKGKLQSQGRYWIVFTGDSITSCEWVHPNWRDMVIYVVQNEMTDRLGGDWKLAEWGIKGFNFAYDGSTTKDIVDRVDEVLLVRPDLVIGLMGGNDPVLGVSVAQHVENIQKVVQKAGEIGSAVAWCTSTPAGEGSKKNPEYEPYAKAFMEAEMVGVQKVDMFSFFQQTPTKRFFTFMSEENPVEGVKAGEIDLQHPNQLGNAYIAKYLLNEVFGVEFDPEKYMQETLEGKKYPGY